MIMGLNLESNYLMSSVIRRGPYRLPKLPQICKLILYHSAKKSDFLILNNLKDLDPSYKTDLDL